VTATQLPQPRLFAGEIRATGCWRQAMSSTLAPAAFSLASAPESSGPEAPSRRSRKWSCAGERAFPLARGRKDPARGDLAHDRRRERTATTRGCRSTEDFGGKLRAKIRHRRPAMRRGKPTGRRCAAVPASRQSAVVARRRHQRRLGNRKGVMRRVDHQRAPGCARPGTGSRWMSVVVDVAKTFALRAVYRLSNSRKVCAPGAA